MCFKNMYAAAIVQWCGTLKCENAAICEKVAKYENNSTLNVKIDVKYVKK